MTPRVFVESHAAVPLAQVLVLAPGGTAADPADQPGLGRHAIELARRGAGGKTRAQLDAALDQLGASLDVVTSTDSFGVAAHGLSRHLPRLIDLLADVLARPTFDPDEHERLRRESLAILDDVRDDDASLAARYFEREIFGVHPYAHPALGTAASLQAMTVAQARAFVERHVRAPSLLFGFAGDVSAEHARELTWRLAAPLAARGDAAPAPAVPEPTAPRGRRTLIVDKPERTQTQILVGHTGPARKHPDWLPLQIAATIFGGTFTSRLMTEVRVKRGWSYGAGCRLGRGRVSSSFRLRVFPSLELTRDTLALVLDLYEGIVATGVTAEEVAFAVGYLSGSWPFELATPGDRLTKKLDTELLELAPDTYPRHLERLAAIDASTVNAAIKRWWRPADAQITLVATAAELEPRIAGLPLGELRVEAFDSY